MIKSNLQKILTKMIFLKHIIITFKSALRKKITKQKLNKKLDMKIKELATNNLRVHKLITLIKCMGKMKKKVNLKN